MNEIAINEIFNYLPHRPPFIMVDRVLNIQAGKSLLAIKNITINEPFFAGHFPEQPIMPGVLILEALAQAASILAFKSYHATPKKDALYLLTGINKARFKKIVTPGDQLLLKAEFLRTRSQAMWFICTALVKDAVACTAEVMCVEKK